MKPKEFEKYLARDKHCLHCGTTETLVPNHRANRGMGGSKKRDVPSNIVVLCARINGEIESDAIMAEVARQYGWKLKTWQEPLGAPVLDLPSGKWYLLTDSFTRNESKG